MIVGKMDLNVGFGVVLWHILVITFQEWYGLSWIAACLALLCIAAVYGLINGVLVALADIDSFVATLGSGTVVYALALWHSGGRQIVANLPDAFLELHHTDIFGIPIAAFYVLAVAVILWIVTENTPVGRCMYAVGGNPVAASLNGIKVNKYIICSFMVSSILTAFVGILVAAEQGVGQASVGMDFMLPALVGLLPMPGGALFSCPLLDDADGEHVLAPVLKTKINYWFRHVWEFCWPLYPGFLLAVDVSGLPVWQLMALMFPLYLAAIAAGTLFLLRQTPRDAYTAPEKEPAERKAFLPLIYPILTIVAVYSLVLSLFPAVGRVSTYLPMLFGVLAALLVLCVQRHVPAAAWRKAAFSPKWVGLVLVIVLAQTYSAFIEAALPGGGALMDRVRGELGAYGIPAVLLVALVPFVSGVTTGITIGYIGASFPVILSLAPEGTMGLFSTIALGFGCGFLGMILSPIHVCLIVTNQYFKTNLAESLSGLVKPAIALFCLIAAYAALLRSLG